MTRLTQIFAVSHLKRGEGATNYKTSLSIPKLTELVHFRILSNPKYFIRMPLCVNVPYAPSKQSLILFFMFQVLLMTKKIFQHINRTIRVK